MTKEPAYPEKEVRNKIIAKVNPKIKKGRAKHSKGKIFLGNKRVATVKIPNDHARLMKSRKLSKIATQLNLSLAQLCMLIDCSMNGSSYYSHLAVSLDR